MSEATPHRIRIGVSTCLTGELVRYDGRTKLDGIVTGELAARFELVPVCPEVEIGMPVPREPIDLQGDPGRPSLVAPGSGRDWTAEMAEWSRARARALAGERLRGYVFKRNSPSCGVYSVPVVQEDGRRLEIGRGFFAFEFIRSHPLVPVIEESALTVPAERESFLERVYAYDAVCRLFEGVWVPDAVRAFHAGYRYVLIAHDPERCAELDELVAKVSEFRPSAFRDSYRDGFMAAISKAASPYGHLEVFQQLAMRLQGRLGAEEQRRLIEAIEEFRTGEAPLTGPVSLLRTYMTRNGLAEAADEIYLDPPWLRAS